MMKFRWFSLLFAVLIGLVGCQSNNGGISHADTGIRRQEATQVVAALASYRQLVINLDSERLADMFTPDGELIFNEAQPYKGRAAVLGYWRAFNGFKVDVYDLRATATSIESGAATQTGSYSQSASGPDGRQYKSSGRFETDWLQQPDGRWLIRRMRVVREAS